MEKNKLLIFILIVLSGIIYYHITSLPNLEKVEIKRVIDGDTIVLENNQKIRLLGINTPEKNQPFFLEAKNYLNNLVKNNEVYIEKIDVDRYGRILAYLFVNDENINKKILENGYAHLYYYNKDKYYDELKNAESLSRKNEIGIWKKSNYSSCFELIELAYYDKGEDNETLVLENNCNKTISVILKDDATHIYHENIKEGVFIKHFKNIFNDDNDTLYIWDDKGYLIIFYRYS